MGTFDPLFYAGKTHLKRLKLLFLLNMLLIIGGKQKSIHHQTKQSLSQMVLAGDYVNTNYGADCGTGDIFYLKPLKQ